MSAELTAAAPFVHREDISSSEDVMSVLNELSWRIAEGKRPNNPYLLPPDTVDDLVSKNKGLQPTRMVLCRLELTLLNMSLPTMVAMVGNTSAPHRIRVADTWSANGLASAGILGTGQPIPAKHGWSKVQNKWGITGWRMDLLDCANYNYVWRFNGVSVDLSNYPPCDTHL